MCMQPTAFAPGIGRSMGALAVVGRKGIGAPGETRTHDLQVRNLTLYPLSYGRARPEVYRAAGAVALGGAVQAR